MKNVLVIGASRGIGRAVCETAARQSHHVKAFSRSGTPISSRRGGTIDVVKGDALNAADLEGALEGVDVVVQALGVPVSMDLITKPVTLFSSATRVLIPAMEKIGVTKLIAVTGFGAGDSNSAINPLQRIPFRAFLGRAYDDKTIQENLIEKSDLDFLFVRPGVLTNGPATGKAKILMQPHEWRNGVVSRADVAEFIVEQLGQETLGRQKPVIIRHRLL